MRWKSYKKLKDWHRWFAWYPILTEDTGEYVWLEKIWRREEAGGFECRYRSYVNEKDYGYPPLKRFYEGL